MEVAITAAGLAVAVYVTVSLLTPREAFDLVNGLARRCRAWRLEYDDPGAAAALMLDRLGRAVTTVG